MLGLAIEHTVTAQWVSFGLLTLAVSFHYQNGVQMTIPTQKAPDLDARKGLKENSVVEGYFSCKLFENSNYRSDRYDDVITFKFCLRQLSTIPPAFVKIE